MSVFKEKFDNFMKEFGVSKQMVLSTSHHDKVSSRMMSIVQIGHVFYFQTDKNFRKYEQLIGNPNVSLCIENIQIEGICREIGRPSEHSTFIDVFSKEYSSSYERYTNRREERLFEVQPVYIQKWIYEEGNSFIEIFDVRSKIYERIGYR